MTAKLICAFVFAYAKIWFSHDAAHFSSVIKCLECKRHAVSLSFDIITIYVGAHWNVFDAGEHVDLVVRTSKAPG